MFANRREIRVGGHFPTCAGCDEMRRLVAQAFTARPGQQDDHLGNCSRDESEQIVEGVGIKLTRYLRIGRDASGQDARET